MNRGRQPTARQQLEAVICETITDPFQQMAILGALRMAPITEAMCAEVVSHLERMRGLYEAGDWQGLAAEVASVPGLGEFLQGRGIKL